MTQIVKFSIKLKLTPKLPLKTNFSNFTVPNLILQEFGSGKEESFDLLQGWCFNFWTEPLDLKFGRGAAENGMLKMPNGDTL